MSRFVHPWSEIFGPWPYTNQSGFGLQEKPEASRMTINEWIANKTENRIKDTLPEGSIDTNTILVLVNAIYFKVSEGAKRYLLLLLKSKMSLVKLCNPASAGPPALIHWNQLIKIFSHCSICLIFIFKDSLLFVVILVQILKHDTRNAKPQYAGKSRTCKSSLVCIFSAI